MYLWSKSLPDPSYMRTCPTWVGGSQTCNRYKAGNSKAPSGWHPIPSCPLLSLSPLCGAGSQWSRNGCDYSRAWSTGTNPRILLGPSRVQLTLQWPWPNSLHLKNINSCGVPAKGPCEGQLQAAREKILLRGVNCVPSEIWLRLDVTLQQTFWLQKHFKN